jgi:hypothetical protein
METDEKAKRQIVLIQSAEIAQASDELLDIKSLARDLDASEPVIYEELEQLEETGLVLIGLDEGFAPMVLAAGKQYMIRQGKVPREVLRFLPRVIDDLTAREALIHAGIVLIDEFRYQLIRGRALEHAAQLVPPAFEQAVDDRLALNLFAAAVALMARLSDGRPAGCVAEEIMAVNLMEEAKVHLEMRQHQNTLTDDEAAAAEEALDGLFELFEDDDVLNLFDMSEPGDAAMANHDPLNQELGIADQRVQSWFVPFSWTIPTGYLSESA